jgi:hypothetical protein
MLWDNLLLIVGSCCTLVKEVKRKKITFNQSFFLLRNTISNMIFLNRIEKYHSYISVENYHREIIKLFSLGSVEKL